jgi:16S rRNA (uracil1498-N3)-methyltransferase
VIPRFFVPAADTIGSTIDLPDDEAAHLARVLRLKAGADVLVFDGRGREWQAIVDRVTKSTAAVRLVTAISSAPEPGVAIALAMAVLKADKTDEVIRDAVMLGVASVQPLLTDRSEVRASPATSGRRQERWQRIAVSSAKQCGRAVVPPIHPATTIDDVLATAVVGLRLALVEPRSATASVRTLRDVPRPARVQLIVGPEGGWSDREIQALGAASMLVTLGAQTLRADAVPVVAMTALRVAWDDF